MFGVVLAGGRSQRLGQDKTQVIYAGQSLLARSINLLRQYCSEVYVSCRDPQIVPPRVKFIVDTTARIGPLGGILSSLQYLQRPILVLACDLPFMEGRYLQKLIQARHQETKPHILTTWQEEQTGYIQTLVAIYEPQAQSFLERGLALQKYKLNTLFPLNLCHLLSYSVQERRVFFNVNYPQDLEDLQHQDQSKKI